MGIHVCVCVWWYIGPFTLATWRLIGDPRNPMASMQAPPDATLPERRPEAERMAQYELYDKLYLVSQERFFFCSRWL